MDSLQPKETAAVIRRILKQEFPAARFSVTTARGSMVWSVDVRWTDGPTTGRVDAIVKRFEAGRFDGMTDSYDYDSTRRLVVDGKTYRPGCRFVSTQRDLSPALARRCAVQVAHYYGIDGPTIAEKQHSDGTAYWHIENDTRHVEGVGECWSTLIYRAAGDATRYHRAGVAATARA